MTFTRPARRLVASTLALLLCACAAAPKPVAAPAVPPPAASVAVRTHESLNANLWQQTAVEYDASAAQAYRAARAALDRALADVTWTAALEQKAGFGGLPPAIILDVDETVLDNSAYNARRIAAGGRYTRETWHAWCEERAATPIAGAVELTQYAASRGVTVFYVTNRESVVHAATKDNLRRVGFPLRDDRETLFTRGLKPEWDSSDKGPRRAVVAAEYRVLLLIGDDFNDFLSGAKTSRGERDRLATEHSVRWGESWIILPNPVYGSWEDAVLGNERGLSEEEISRRKFEALSLPHG